LTGNDVSPILNLTSTSKSARVNFALSFNH
jgi:hypothetical protein